eukprot:Rmarinus@m.23647
MSASYAFDVDKDLDPDENLDGGFHMQPGPGIQSHSPSGYVVLHGGQSASVLVDYESEPGNDVDRSTSSIPKTSPSYDALPDEIVELIFLNVEDVETLCAAAAVSTQWKRVALQQSVAKRVYFAQFGGPCNGNNTNWRRVLRRAWNDSRQVVPVERWAATKGHVAFLRHIYGPSSSVVGQGQDRSTNTVPQSQWSHSDHGRGLGWGWGSQGQRQEHVMRRERQELHGSQGRHCARIQEQASLDLALDGAAESGTAATVRLLVEFGANVNHRNRRGATPLIVCAYYGNTEAAAELLRNDPDLESTERFYAQTALAVASSRGHLDMVRLLADAGANFHHRDRDMYTPLRIAASKNHIQIFEYLESLGAQL